jgi:hypothetical protein
MPKQSISVFRLRKKAFDVVMQAYRDSVGSELGATQYSDRGSPSEPGLKPTPLDFRCDVDRVIKKCVRNLGAFRAVYIDCETDDEIEIGRRAQRIIGGGMHNLEQGMGALFIHRELSPPSKYFKINRQRMIR